MNAYLFSAAITQSQLRYTGIGRNQTAETLQTWNACHSLIVCGESADEAQEQFETRLRSSPEGQNPIHTGINKIVAAQFIDQLFTESGHEPIDWTHISQRVEPTLERSEDDNLDQGYWTDANLLVRPEKLSVDIESLQRDLPEEVRSGLNWSANRQFFFIVSVLSPPSPPPISDDDPEPDITVAEEAADEDPAESGESELDAWQASLPELADKQVAALVQARNSIVAAWLWRKFAADTQFAGNDIDIDPWCGLLVTDEEEARPGKRD